MLILAVAWSASKDIAIRYVISILWMTSYLPVIGQAKARPVGCTLIVSGSPGGSTDSIPPLIRRMLKVTRQIRYDTMDYINVRPKADE